MASQMTKPGLTNLQPYTVAAFQKRDGSGLLWVGGCLEIKGAGSDTFQTAYEFCQSASGLTRYDIDQVSDPTPIQLSARGDAVMQQALYNMWKRSHDTGCLVNLLVLQRDCVDASRVKDPNFFVRGYWMRGMRATGRWTFGNDTLVGMNPKSPQMTEDQGSFICGSIEPFMQEAYSTVNGAVTAAPLNIAVADIGNCPTGDCGADQDGGNVVFALYDSAGASKMLGSYDAGATFADVTASITVPTGWAADAPWFLAAVNGRLVYASRDSVSKNVQIGVLTLNAALNGFTATAATIIGSGTPKNTVGLAGNKPIVAPDGMLIWAGKNEVYKSANNGATWTRIASAVTAQTTGAEPLDFSRIAVRGSRVFGITRNNDDDETIYVYSDDSGVTWTLASYVVEAASTAVELAVVGNRVFVINDGDVFEWTNNGVGTTDLTPAGITSIKNIIALGDNGNDMLIVANDNAIWRSVDGLNTAHLETTGISFPAGLSSYARVSTSHNDSILIAGGTILGRAKANGFLF